MDLPRGNYALLNMLSFYGEMISYVDEETYVDEVCIPFTMT